MARDAEATRARILAAAIEEFAAHGLAGGRVERISTSASANSRMIYVYFGSKEGLFDAVVEHVLGQLGAEVPMTEDDLPGFAVRRFDQLTARPEAIRINLWRVLERPGAGPDDTDLYRAKVNHLRAATSGAPSRTAIAPADLIILVANMAAAWVSSPRDLQAADGTDPTSPQRLAQHRASLEHAVRCLTR